MEGPCRTSASRIGHPTPLRAVQGVPVEKRSPARCVGPGLSASGTLRLSKALRIDCASSDGGPPSFVRAGCCGASHGITGPHTGHAWGFLKFFRQDCGVCGSQCSPGLRVTRATRALPARPASPRPRCPPPATRPWGGGVLADLAVAGAALMGAGALVWFGRRRKA